jgi:hypothetical protein
MPPLVRLLIPSSAGRPEGQMRGVLAMAAMPLDDDDVAALERFPPHRAQEILSAWDATLHEGPEPRVGVLRKRGASALRHGPDNRPRNHAVMEPLADLAAPVSDIDLGPSSAQRRLPTHGDERLAWPTMATALRDRAHLVGIAAPEPLGHQVSIGGRILTRTTPFKPRPVIGQYLCEDVPGLSRLGNHQSAPSWGSGIVAVPLFFPQLPPSVQPLSGLHRGTLTRLSHPGVTGTSGEPKNENS